MDRHTRHIDRRTKSEAERIVRKLNEVFENLAPYRDVAYVADLLARGEEASSIDGYPANSGGQSDIHGGRLSRPTEDAVARKAGGKFDYTTEMAVDDDSWRVQPDPLAEAIAMFSSGIGEVHGLSKIVHRKAQVVLKAADGLRGRVSSLAGVCARCGDDIAGTPNDRMRAGYDAKCYQAWLRAGRPDRLQFERQYRSETEKVREA